MSEQSPEIFDDLYLGLQAGGALRKQRRGEELTEQEAAALGHWQRLSVWRKAIAIGAFAFGTFGLGFTLGGLIFGRRRATLRRRAVESVGLSRARRPLNALRAIVQPRRPTVPCPSTRGIVRTRTLVRSRQRAVSWTSCPSKSSSSTAPGSTT